MHRSSNVCKLGGILDHDGDASDMHSRDNVWRDVMELMKNGSIVDEVENVRDSSLSKVQRTPRSVASFALNTRSRVLTSFP